MSYLVPTGRLSEREREAVRSVAALMEVGDEAKEDLALQQEANREEDREWAETHDGSEEISASTRRILDQYNENRQRGVDISDDFHLTDIDSDAEALAEPTDDAAAREAKAIASVAQLRHAGVVRYNDETEEPAISPDDYEAFDRECLTDFPDYAKPVRQAPAPASVADDGDDGFDGDRGPYEGPRRASSPPSFNPG